MSEVRDISAFARAWWHSHRLPEDLIEDAVQEAHLASLTLGRAPRTIARAIDRFRKKEWRTDPPLSAIRCLQARAAGPEASDDYLADIRDW